jgi:hypothetical protein
MFSKKKIIFTICSFIAQSLSPKTPIETNPSKRYNASLKKVLGSRVYPASVKTSVLVAVLSGLLVPTLLVVAKFNPSNYSGNFIGIRKPYDLFTKNNLLILSNVSLATCGISTLCTIYKKMVWSKQVLNAFKEETNEISSLISKSSKKTCLKVLENELLLSVPRGHIKDLYFGKDREIAIAECCVNVRKAVRHRLEELKEKKMQRTGRA